MFNLKNKKIIVIALLALVLLCLGTMTVRATEPCADGAHTWDAGSETTAPTCTTDGVLTKTCTVSGCGATTTEAIPATGHTWDAGSETTAPTCTTDGVLTKTCTVSGCGATTTEAIPATGHDWEEEGTVTTTPGCTTAGVMTYECNDCDATKTEAIEPTGHDWDYANGQVTKEPTFDEEGTMVYTCENNSEHKLTVTIDKLTMTLSEDEATEKAIRDTLIEMGYDPDEVDVIVESWKVNMEYYEGTKTLDRILKKMEEELPEGKIAGLYNIVVEILKNDNVEELMTVTKGKIKIKINVPEDLPAVAEGFVRKFYMIRVHDGFTDIIDVILSKDGKTGEFESDKFSIYALVYEDVLKDDTPHTGDVTIVYAIALATISLAGVALVNKKSRK